MPRLIEEHLYWAGTIHERWVIHKEISLVQYARALGDPPPDLKPLRESILKQYAGQGMGRHSSEEVIHSAKTDLAALSAFLDDHLYFMGEQPTSLDATAYGFLVHFLWAGYESELNTYAKSLPNLQGYCQRMRERYYGVNA
jgi:glutathione S-transferase